MKKMIQTTRKERENTGSGMNEFLDSLSLENRVIFMRHYWFCDTYAEIASRYGISERKVKRLLQEPREQMCTYLGKPWGSFGINHVDAKFVREAEDVVFLRERKRFPNEYQSILNDLIDFLLKRFLSFPEHA